MVLPLLSWFGLREGGERVIAWRIAFVLVWVAASGVKVMVFVLNDVAMTNDRMDERSSPTTKK